MSLSNEAYLQVNRSVFSIANAYRSKMQREGRDKASGLNLADRSVLMVLGQCTPITAAKLSEMMDINPGTISVYVQRLVRKGLVARSQDSQDRRTWHLTLTPQGQEVARETHRGAAAYTQQFLASLTDDEQRILHRLLLKVVRDVGYDWI